MLDGEVIVPWSNLQPGMRMRWITPRFVKHGTLVKRGKRRSLRIRFDGDKRDTVIPDAAWYYSMARSTDDRENRLAVWEGPSHSVDLQPDTDGDEWLSASAAAKSHGVEPKDLRRWLRAGKVAGHQRNGQWIVDATSLSKWLADR